MRNFKLGYKSGGSRNYLCVETEEEISSYQLKMLEANEIPGLLRVHGTKLNGEYCFNYDITGIQLLKDALESRSIRGEKAKRLLLDLLSALFLEPIHASILQFAARVCCGHSSLLICSP